MEIFFSLFSEKIKTKNDLVFYLKEISLAKDLVFKFNQDADYQKNENKILVEINSFSDFLGEGIEDLLNQLSEKENQYNQFLVEEKDLRERKEKIREKMLGIISTQERDTLQSERENIEDERKEKEANLLIKEEEIIKIKKELSDKKIDFSNIDTENILKIKEQKEWLKNPENQFSFLSSLEDYLSSLPIIRLGLAVLPSKKIIFDISKWLKNETGKNYIIDVETNPELIAGATIEYNGRWLDFSVSKKMEDFSFFS